MAVMANGMNRFNISNVHLILEFQLNCDFFLGRLTSLIKLELIILWYALNAVYMLSYDSDMLDIHIL